MSRSPGRVNIIGEHIDYCGFPVFPMAIYPCVLSAASISLNSSDVCYLKLLNTDSKFPSKTVVCKSDIQFDSSDLHWTNYVLAGFKGALEYMPVDLSGLDITVLFHGTVPHAAGLSSSSALVCASAICMLGIVSWKRQDHSEICISTEELAKVCCECEKYVGTQGGGMDQAISILGEEGYAKFIEFRPELKTKNVKLPDEVVWVVANCMREAQKTVSVADKFNKRVVECRLGCALLGKFLFGSLKCKVFKELLEMKQDISLGDLKILVAEKFKNEPYSVDDLKKVLDVENLAEVCDDLGRSAEEVFKIASESGFELKKRALHVLSEAERVYQVVEECLKGSTGNIAKLLDDSHTSCAELYECSCNELDQLQRVCKEAGALGSRMTGAGWGGCVISMVLKTDLDTFLHYVRKHYFDKLHCSYQDNMFVTCPGPGAALLMLP